MNRKFNFLPFLLVIGLIFLSSICHAQKVNIDVQNQSIQSIIEQIAKEHDLHFSFSTDKLASIKTSITAKDEALGSVLSRLLKPHDLVAKKNKGNFYYIVGRKKQMIFLVTSAEDNMPVSYASLRIKGTYRGGYANEDGVAILSLDELIDTSLILSSVGYKDVEYELLKSGDDTIKVEMKQDWQNLFEIEVHEYLNKAVQLNGDISNVSLRPDEMEVLPGLPEADILLSVQMLPGFDSNNETASGLNIRGGSKDQGLIYWDGIPVYQAAHYFGSITSFIPTAVKEINTYKNYIPTNFSGATSGLLDIKVYDSIPDKLSAISNTTFTHSDLLLKAPVGKRFAVLIGGRTSYNHVINTPAFNSYSEKLFDGSRNEDVLNSTGEDDDDLQLQINSELKFWDLNGKLIWSLNDKNYFSVSGILNKDGLNFTGFDQEDSSSTIQNHNVQFGGANFTYNRKWNENWNSEVSLSYSDYQMKNSFQFSVNQVEDSVNDRISIANNLNNIELKIGTTYDGFKNSRVQFGYQLNSYYNEVLYEESFKYEQPYADTLQTYADVHGVYLAIEKNVKDKLIIRPQLRADYFTLSESIVVNPVLNLQYNIGKGFWFKSSYGHYSQALRSVNDLDLSVSNVSESIWLLADNDEFDVLQSRQFTIGGMFQKKGWLIDVDFYMKNVAGLSALNQVATEITEDLVFATGTGKIQGMDVMLKKKFGRYSSWMSYSLTKTNHLFPELQSTVFPSSLDRPHQFRWVHSLNLNQFEVSLGWTYKSGSPYTRANGIVYYPAYDYYELTYESTNASRLPNYHRLDFSLWYNFPNKEKKFNGTIGFSLLNIYDQDNVWNRFYYLEDINDDDIPEIIEEERSFLGLTPNLTVKLRF